MLYWNTSKKFEYYLNLHYSQTSDETGEGGVEFEYYLNLHYSQTTTTLGRITRRFEYYLNLHYSQTRADGFETGY